MPPRRPSGQTAPYPGDPSRQPSYAELSNPQSQQQSDRSDSTGTDTQSPVALSSATSHPQRYGDRGDGGDDGDARLPALCRFPDLTAAGIATSWKQLQTLIVDEGFPRGIMLSKNTRAWPVRDVERWLAGRPSAAKTVNVAKQRETLKRKHEQQQDSAI
jgi:predicted DNA-binding transcriptional regulator AlpA